MKNFTHTDQIIHVRATCVAYLQLPILIITFAALIYSGISFSCMKWKEMYLLYKGKCINLFNKIYPLLVK